MFVLNKYKKAGDILLIRSNSKIGAIIANATRGAFSHAAFVVSDRKIIEALGDVGVQVSSIDRFIFRDSRNIRVFRSNLNIDEYEKLKNYIDNNHIFNHQSKSYDTKGAIKSILNLDKKIDNEKFFCSKLVARVFEEIGVVLVEKNTENITPNDFLKSSKLKDVTDIVLTEVPANIVESLKIEGKEILFLEDGKNSKSKLAQLQRKLVLKAEKIFQKFNRKIRISCSDDIISNLIMELPREHFESLDKELTQLYIELQINESIKIKNTFDIDKDFESYLIDCDIFGFEETTTSEYIRNFNLSRDFKIDCNSKHKVFDSFFELYNTCPCGYLALILEYYKIILYQLKDYIDYLDNLNLKVIEEAKKRDFDLNYHIYQETS